MYMMSKLAAGSVIAAAAAVGSANLALADGYAAKPAAAARPRDWSGVYFGVGSGYQWSSIDVSSPVFAGLGLPNPPGSAFTSDHDEAFVSAHLGVQQRFGNIVLGIEGGWMSTLRDRPGNHEFCTEPVLGPIRFRVRGPGESCTAR